MNKNLSKAIVAVVIYSGFAIYLYQPYFKSFNVPQYLFVVNACVASLGCFVLSRRWIASFAGSFFAGVIYGFGPFLLGLAKFHPTAGFLVAIVPWLFCPAAFGFRTKWRWFTVSLCALPFLAILLFFQAAICVRLFAVPIRAGLNLADLIGLLAPLIMVKRSLTLIGFYHIPVMALVMGFLMLIAARRFGVMIIFTLFPSILYLILSTAVFEVSTVITKSFEVESVFCTVSIEGRNARFSGAGSFVATVTSLPNSLNTR